MAMGTRSRGQVPSTNRPRLTVRSAYEDFKPLIDSNEDAEAHSVHIHLPGFLKEQIRIVAESGRNLLRVRGERLVSGNTWKRFQEEIVVPENCDITETRAKFEAGVLRITMPKRITAVASQSSSPSELSSEAPTPERSPLSTSRPAPPRNPAPLRPAVPTSLQPPPAPEPRPSSLRPTKMPEVPRPENRPPPRAEGLASQRTPAAVPRPEALPPPLKQLEAPRPSELPPPHIVSPRMTPSYQPIPSPPQPSRQTLQPPLPHPDATRLKPGIYPTPQENEKSRFESSQIPSFPRPLPPPGLLQALPQPDPATKNPIPPEKWRTEPDQAPIQNPIGTESWRNESKPAPMRDPPNLERRRTEPDPAPMIDLKRRRMESEPTMPLKKPVTSTSADLTGKTPMRYESLTDEEKRRFGMRGMRLRGLEEDRQLLVNMGVAVLVLVSFGAWISYSFGSSSSNQ